MIIMPVNGQDAEASLLYSEEAEYYHNLIGKCMIIKLLMIHCHQYTVYMLWSHDKMR